MRRRSALIRTDRSLCAQVMDQNRLDAMKKAIVGLLMSVDEVEGSFKLNQHKSDVDHAAVATALEQQPEAAARVVAREMRALRPHLDYKSPTPVSVVAD